MIQRIQTIFLILFIVSIVTSFFFPVWQKIELEEGSEEIESLVTGYVSYNFIEEKFEKGIIYDHFHVSAALILCCILSAFSIFSYKNRMRQIKIGLLNSLLTSLIVFYFLYDIFYKELYNDINDKISFLISFYLIFLAIFFNFLSNRFIRKDEYLVRESDRIR